MSVMMLVKDGRAYGSEAALLEECAGASEQLQPNATFYYFDLHPYWLFKLKSHQGPPWPYR